MEKPTIKNFLLVSMAFFTFLGRFCSAARVNLAQQKRLDLIWLMHYWTFPPPPKNFFG